LNASNVALSPFLPCGLPTTSHRVIPLHMDPSFPKPRAALGPSNLRVVNSRFIHSPFCRDQDGVGGEWLNDVYFISRERADCPIRGYSIRPMRGGRGRSDIAGCYIGIYASTDDAIMAYGNANAPFRNGSMILHIISNRPVVLRLPSGPTRALVRAQTHPRPR
jgi:hypothetical protein